MRLYFIETQKNETFCSLHWNVNKSTVVTIIYSLFQDRSNRNVCSAFWREQWLGVLSAKSICTRHASRNIVSVY